MRDSAVLLGEEVQVDPIKPTLKAPVTKRLKLNCDEPLSNFAFKIILRRYNLEIIILVLVGSGGGGAPTGVLRLFRLFRVFRVLKLGARMKKLEVGADTRSLFSSTSAVSDTQARHTKSPYTP